MSDNPRAVDTAGDEGVSTPESAETTAPAVETPEAAAEAPAQEAASQDGAPQPEASEDEDGERDQRPQKRNRRSARERISELNRRAKEAEARAERAEARSKALAGEARPRLEDYDDPDAFEEARIRYAMRTERASEFTEEAKAAAEERSAVEAEGKRAVLEDYWQRAHEFASAASLQDYEQVAVSAPISEPLAMTIAEMDEGPALAYHLGKNHNLARRLSTLPPMQAALELGRLAGRVGSGPRPKVVSQAPPPVAPATASGAPGTPDPEKESFSAYKLRRERELGYE